MQGRDTYVYNAVCIHAGQEMISIRLRHVERCIVTFIQRLLF